MGKSFNELTDADFIAALNNGINFIKSSAEKEKRPLSDFEQELICSSEKTIKKIQKVVYFFKHIQELAKKDYRDEAIILSITYFEILMRDLIKENKDSWFLLPSSQFSQLSPENKELLRKKIRKYLENLNLYEEYLKNIHLYQDIKLNPEIEALYYTLFDDENEIEKIKFQNLSAKNGVKEAIKFFYDINIVNCFDTDRSTSHKKWSLLSEFIQERHNIVHSGDRTKFTAEEIIRNLASIENVISVVRQKQLNYLWIKTKKNFEETKKILRKKYPDI
jgi:hypothetical protein